MKRVSVISAVAVAVVLAACEQPGVPLRLTPYEFGLFGSDTVFHWPAFSLPVRFYAEPVGQLPQYVRDGVRAWQRQLLYGELSSAMVEDSVSADVIVVLEGNPPPDAPLTDDPLRFVCAGVTLLPPRETNADGETRFSSRLRVSVRWFPGADPTDAQNCLAMVTMHELGHALGLFRHSSDPMDLMYSEPAVRTPSLRDQSTIGLLYHSPSDILPWRPDAATAAAAGPGEAIQ